MNDATQRHYEELAELHDRKGEARQRDIYLVLAADAACSAGNPAEAERLRTRLLQLSPHNLLRPFPSFAEALRSTDILDYVSDLRRQYPPDQAAKLPGAGPLRPSTEPAVYKLQEPAPAAPPRRRPTTKSPYDVPPPFLTPTPASEPSGRWVTDVLFVIVLAGALGLVWWTLVRPML